jgi:hypothetical protein
MFRHPPAARDLTVVLLGRHYAVAQHSCAHAAAAHRAQAAPVPTDLRSTWVIRLADLRGAIRRNGETMFQSYGTRNLAYDGPRPGRARAVRSSHG